MRIPELPSAAIWIAAGLAITSLGVASGPVVWRLSGESGQIPDRADRQADGDTPRLDLGPILTFSPFGSASAVSEPSAAVVGETGLGLTLLGVTIAAPAGRSRAIIAGGEVARAVSYAVGSQITSAAALHEVTRTHVVLEVDGRLETLSFAKPGTSAAAPGGTDLRNLIESGSDPEDTPVSNDADAVIARYRAAILQDPQSVIGRLGLEATENGYRISEAASPGVQQAGFRPGDLITTVNGRKVGDIPSDQRYFDEVAESGRARVELQRDGQTIIMTFPLR